MILESIYNLDMGFYLLFNPSIPWDLKGDYDIY